MHILQLKWKLFTFLTRVSHCALFIQKFVLKINWNKLFFLKNVPQKSWWTESYLTIYSRNCKIVNFTVIIFTVKLHIYIWHKIAFKYWQISIKQCRQLDFYSQPKCNVSPTSCPTSNWCYTDVLCLLGNVVCFRLEICENLLQCQLDLQPLKKSWKVCTSGV